MEDIYNLSYDELKGSLSDNIFDVVSVNKVNSPSLVILKKDIIPLVKVAMVYSKFSQDTYSRSLYFKVVSDVEVLFVYMSGIVTVRRVVLCSGLGGGLPIGYECVLDLFSFNKVLNFVKDSIILSDVGGKVYVYLQNGRVNIPVYYVSNEFYYNSGDKVLSELMVVDSKFIDVLGVFSKLILLGLRVEDRCINIDSGGIYFNTSIISAQCDRYCSNDNLTLQKVDVDTIISLFKDSSEIVFRGNDIDLVVESMNTKLFLSRKVINVSRLFMDSVKSGKMRVNSKFIYSILYFMSMMPYVSGVVGIKSLGGGIKFECYSRSGEELCSFDVFGEGGGLSFKDLSYSLLTLKGFFNSFEGDIDLYIVGNKVYVDSLESGVLARIDVSYFKK